MLAKNYCYTKVVLNDNMPVDDSLLGRERVPHATTTYQKLVPIAPRQT